MRAAMEKFQEVASKSAVGLEDLIHTVVRPRSGARRGGMLPAVGRPRKITSNGEGSTRSRTMTMASTQSLIVTGVRTPMGAFMGALARVPAVQLGAICVKAL